MCVKMNEQGYSSPHYLEGRKLLSDMEIVKSSIVYLYHLLKLFRIIDHEECIMAWETVYRIICSVKSRIKHTQNNSNLTKKKAKICFYMYIYVCVCVYLYIHIRSYTCLLGNTLKRLTVFLSLWWDCGYIYLLYLYIS